MKIHYNDEFNCYETTECNKTNSIELDGVKLIPITKIENIKVEIERLKPNNPNFEHYVGETRAINNVLEVIDKQSELKGENNG